MPTYEPKYSVRKTKKKDKHKVLIEIEFIEPIDEERIKILPITLYRNNRMFINSTGCNVKEVTLVGVR